MAKVTVQVLRGRARVLRVYPYKHLFPDLSNYCSMSRKLLVDVFERYDGAICEITACLRNHCTRQKAARTIVKFLRRTVGMRVGRKRRRPSNDADIIDMEELDPRGYPHVFKRMCNGQILGYNLRTLQRGMLEHGSFQDPLRWGTFFSEADMKRLDLQARELDKLHDEASESVMDHFRSFDAKRHEQEYQHRTNLFQGIQNQMETAVGLMIQVVENDVPSISGKAGIIDLAQEDTEPSGRNSILTGFATELQCPVLEWTTPVEAMAVIEMLKGPFYSALSDAIQISTSWTLQFAEQQVQLIKGLPSLGHGALQEELLRFMATARRFIVSKQQLQLFAP